MCMATGAQERRMEQSINQQTHAQRNRHSAIAKLIESARCQIWFVIRSQSPSGRMWSAIAIASVLLCLKTDPSVNTDSCRSGRQLMDTLMGQTSEKATAIINGKSQCMCGAISIISRWFSANVPTSNRLATVGDAEDICNALLTLWQGKQIAHSGTETIVH